MQLLIAISANNYSWTLIAIAISIQLHFFPHFYLESVSLEPSQREVHGVCGRDSEATQG